MRESRVTIWRWPVYFRFRPRLAAGSAEWSQMGSNSSTCTSTSPNPLEALYSICNLHSAIRNPMVLRIWGLEHQPRPRACGIAWRGATAGAAEELMKAFIASAPADYVLVTTIGERVRQEEFRPSGRAVPSGYLVRSGTDIENLDALGFVETRDRQRTMQCDHCGYPDRNGAIRTGHSSPE